MRIKKLIAVAVLMLGLQHIILAQNPTVEFTVNGLKVILRQTQKETLVMNMYFRGGSSNYTASKAGIESLALSAILDCGNSTYSATDFNDKVDEFGLHLTSLAESDFSVVKLSCISRYVTEAWKLFAAAINAPVFDNQKFALLKERKISDLKGALSNPDERLQSMAQEFAFANTTYAINPSGTTQTLSSLTRDAVKDYYYNTLLNRNRMFLVVAGNISKEDLQNMVNTAFANIPVAPYQAVIPTNDFFDNEAHKIEARPLATNYIAGLINAPTISSDDYPAFRIGVVLLHSAIYDVIRQSKQLSYAPSARLTDGNLPYVTMYASTTQPDETIKAMRMVLNYMKSNRLSEKLVNNVRKSVVDSYKKRQEIMLDIADNLGKAEIAGNWKLAENLEARMKNIDIDDISNVIGKYAQSVKWVYIGNPKQVQNTFR
jgi:zinc protease